MFELGRHGGFILASYVATVAILGGLILASIHGYRTARRRLKAMEGDSHG